ncbi:MAG: GTPase/DUF3482 domain-containing protein [Deltaproteobacteria bacterium]|nr:GTPase/DUF3482 domain-containing protein [Deltaproteobacteria bacterium]
MTENRVPEFAIVGHPNEGKSAVVSTLAEDDSVRVSPYPGETIVCQTFPVMIDGREIIRFTDTPGFQNPKKILTWMKKNPAPDDRILRVFRESHAGDPDFREDCELFEPIARGAGIIYVVDGSRPVRKVDLAEMEILRLTGRPRMAIINCKEEEAGYLEHWKSEFRKHFNAIRVFNAHRATCAERIDLLENLKSIDQDWAAALEMVISAFKEDWRQRNALTADIIGGMLEDCLGYSIARNFTERRDEASLRKKLQEDFNRAIEKIEKTAHRKIRKLFKHNIFNYDLPPCSILHEDIFSKKTWQLLGLTPKQLITAAGVAGGGIGVALDVAAAGLTFGVFTAVGGLLGAGWAALGGGKRLARTKVVGLNLGGQQIRIGPVGNIQFMYILLDRALIFYAHIINWAHGRRDYRPGRAPSGQQMKAGFTAQWDEKTKGRCQAFYRAVRSSDEDRKMASRRAIRALLQDQFSKISRSERRYGLIHHEP